MMTNSPERTAFTVTSRSTSLPTTSQAKVTALAQAPSDPLPRHVLILWSVWLLLSVIAVAFTWAQLIQF
jgi:hypothetical protein